ncbi:MAG TPA: PP2C family protein-serine/threonine phosphatase [Thermoanaerobaculia bacterium]|nr:PP2C family protein-serine/threonine phosphatase [Thermoanaerobaculia bacterium]
MSKKSKKKDRPPKLISRMERFFSDYTAGLDTRDLRRMFDKDAVRAYAVLTRGHDDMPEPKGKAGRFFYRAKLTFLGLSYKLTPARRLLFAGSLFAFFVGWVQDPKVITDEGVRVLVVDFSPFWFSLSLAMMAYLLALELADRIRVRDELDVARELQEDLLPHDVPPIPGYDFAHSYRTANEVGGDYYDLTPLPDGRVALLVGDASGHGMAAGLVMAIANATLKTALDLDPTPERVIRLLNRTLCRTGTNRTFMTVFYALLDPATGEMEYVCAGHPFPLLRRADGTIEELGCGSLPLGMREPLEICSDSAVLEPGDLLLLFTDGLAEALDTQGKEAFGYPRITHLTRAGGSPHAVHERILRAFDSHVGDEPIRDDLTLLVAARLPPIPAFKTPVAEPAEAVASN